MITVFKDIKETRTPHVVHPNLMLKYIKEGRYKDKIEKLRTLNSKKDRDKIKMTLPSICWSGQFSQRGNDYCEKHSGLVCIDFDHVLDLDGLKKRICEDQYTHMAFISPSGDGLKVIIKIPDSIQTHADSCKAITDYFNEDTLDEFKDIARVCYISYDPDIYINPESKVFNKLIKEETVTQKFYPTERVSDTNEIYDRIVTWLDKSETYSDGNKHKYLVKLSAACLRFGIPQSECESRLYFNYASRASKVDQKDINKLVSNVYRNYSSVACTAHFETQGTPVYTATKKVIKEEIFQIEVNDKDIIYLDNVKDSMLEGFRTGKAKGSTTYYPDIDKHWTWRKKEIDFLGGIGNIGKTTILNNLMVIKSIKEDWKFAIFSPEQDPPDDFYNDLIHTYIGESTEPYHQNQMAEKVYIESWEFIKKHFFYIYPENESPTPDYINSIFEHAIKKHKVDVCVVDPFNQLDNDWKKYGRDDLYISEFLSKAKRFSQTNNIAYFIAGHPRGSLQKFNGNYEIPNVYDYSGGAMWNNKCDNILCYHRPYATTEPENTECLFISQKIKKRKLTGVPGAVKLKFDIYTNRFIQENGFCPFDKKEEIQIQNNYDLTPVQSEWYDQEARELDDVPF